MHDSCERYGFFPGNWSAAQAAAASRDFAELQVSEQGVFWIEFNPQDGRNTLWRWHGESAQCLTPAHFSLRSRVHEYGGGVFCLTDSGVAFVNDSDQQLYLQHLKDGSVQPLGEAPLCRYGDLQFDRVGHALLAVEECHGQGRVRNRLVSIALADGERSVLAEGSDFYASPTLSADGQRLAWIEWDRPAQPWTHTRLCSARRDARGIWPRLQVLAGGISDESLQQPRFTVDSRLLCLSDRDGWWQPWGDVDGQWQRLAHAADADHGSAPWQLGSCSYLPLELGELLLTRFDQGWGELVWQAASGEERRLAADFSRFRALAADGEHFYCIAAAPNCLSAVIAISRSDGQVRVLAGGEQPLPAEQLALPERLDYLSAGERAYGFFYAPTQPSAVSEQPPLVVFLHGGPTSACYPVFDPRIQFWTARGFAVADLNYRGSSNFGRAYRQRLEGQWGVIDVEDAVAVVAHLAEAGRIDPQRAFIRGGSAGGYTALCALAFHAVFRGGASLYGVSDPLALRRVTHKFEGDYLDWLIGDPDLDADRYKARTPLLHADKISAPVIFFQGGRDAVVLPEQTASMVAALQAQGVPVEQHFYPDEGHGFRQAGHLQQVMELELGFYQRLL
ncbi:MAG: S9 family peptidase [Pseudomonas sp.]|uniref:alpha/beta hydrolase family protein n=1 Tax=Pseudomonas sp. TaxID=306 RepID=UPI0030F22DB7